MSKKKLVKKLREAIKNKDIKKATKYARELLKHLYGA